MKPDYTEVFRIYHPERKTEVDPWWLAVSVNRISKTSSGRVLCIPVVRPLTSHW